MPWGVDQVELVLDARLADVLQPDCLGLDGNAPLPLQVHRVQVLIHHPVGVDGAGRLQQPVRQRRLAVVDVGDDREVANELLVHATMVA